MNTDDFVAIDFETANDDHASACAVGVATVRGGAVVDTYSSLIRPPTTFFKYTGTHGLAAQTVAGAPTFADIWPEIQRRCGGGIVAAHKASFDMGVIAKCVAHYKLPRPSIQYVCTCRLARCLVPGLANYQLPTVAGHYGIALNHHEATSDAVACAELAIRLFRLAPPAALDGLVQRLA
jgi:DNA polymerase-3 subunit epsilon